MLSFEVYYNFGLEIEDFRKCETIFSCLDFGHLSNFQRTDLLLQRPQILAEDTSFQVKYCLLTKLKIWKL